MNVIKALPLLLIGVVALILQVAVELVCLPFVVLGMLIRRGII